MVRDSGGRAEYRAEVEMWAPRYGIGICEQVIMGPATYATGPDEIRVIVVRAGGAVEACHAVYDQLKGLAYWHDIKRLERVN